MSIVKLHTSTKPFRLNEVCYLTNVSSASGEATHWHRSHQLSVEDLIW